MIQLKHTVIEQQRAIRELRLQLTEVETQRDVAKRALETIRDNDWVENALDPQFAAGVAREALTKLEEKIK